MDIFKRSQYTIENSNVQVKLITSLDWEDLVIFRAKARMHEKQFGIAGILIPTYRTLKDYLIKGE